jgi:biopolymer transport protein ExbD
MSTETRPVSDINITPLIDVMLVLLIIFMVVVPVAGRGLDAALPRPPASEQGTTVPPHVMVTVDRTGVAVGGTPFMTMADLQSHLREVFAARRERIAFVRASGSVEYSRVVEVVDSVAGAGADRIGLVLTARSADEVGGRRAQ